jgi:RNA polymerase sigma-70 factor (ECF subfamily)
MDKTSMARRSRDTGIEPSGKAAYDRYASELNRYLVRRVHRPEDVADLTQDIFELFLRRKDRTQVVRNPLAYLFRIAFHVVGTALEDEERNPVTFDSMRTAEDQPAARSSSSEDAEELVAQSHVRAALAQLPQNHLTALMLVEGQGMSYKEASRVSGFTPSTIATYVMHARAALKLALDGHGHSIARAPGAAE